MRLCCGLLLLLLCSMPLEASEWGKRLGIVPLPVPHDTGCPLVVFFSGDGGWAPLDRGVSGQLQAAGCPVVGWSTLTYFWQRRTPDEVTADLVRILDHYEQQWPQRQLVLVGFSFGAEIVPFLINRLPAHYRQRLVAGVMLSPTTNSDFEIHVGDILMTAGKGGYPTLPETERIRDIPLFCFYGIDDDEPDDLCSRLHQQNVTGIGLPGGHHFEDDYPWMAEILLPRIWPRSL